MADDRDLYRYHVANLRSLNIALRSTGRAAHSAIASQNAAAAQSFVRLYAFLLGAWAETRLRKLLYEQFGFTSLERQRILGCETQLEQWRLSVELAFRRHYAVPTARLAVPAVPHSAASRYEAVVAMISEWLAPVITVRNKLAHGQWVYPLTSEGDGVATEYYCAINQENVLSLQWKKNIIETLAQLVHELVVSPPTFDRDFDLHYARLAHTINNLKNRDYSAYEAQAVARRQRGIARRREAS